MVWYVSGVRTPGGPKDGGATQPALASYGNQVTATLVRLVNPLWFRYAAEYLNVQRKSRRRLLNRRWLSRMANAG